MEQEKPISKKSKKRNKLCFEKQFVAQKCTRIKRKKMYNSYRGNEAEDAVYKISANHKSKIFKKIKKRTK